MVISVVVQKDQHFTWKWKNLALLLTAFARGSDFTNLRDERPPRQMKARRLNLTSQRQVMTPHIFVLAAMFVSREEIETGEDRMVH